MGQHEHSGASAGDNEARTEAPMPTRARRWYGAALVACVLLVIGGVALLPVVVQSIIGELVVRQDRRLYNLNTGNIVVPGEEIDPNAPNFLNIATVDLNVAAGTVTLAISGNRVCLVDCPEVELIFLSLDDDASRRRGISPSASVVLGEDQVTFSESIELPVRGRPVQYPFDSYELWLGLANPPDEQSGAAGGVSPPPPVSNSFYMTVQNQVPQIIMSPPEQIAGERVRKPSRALTIQVVQGLTYHRPVYLTVLTVAMVLLVAASGALALLTQSIDSLVLGVGGLILGIWGVRSVLVPQPVGVITAVDLALSGVIFLLLLGLAVRAALYLKGRMERGIA